MESKVEQETIDYGDSECRICPSIFKDKCEGQYGGEDTAIAGTHFCAWSWCGADIFGKTITSDMKRSIHESSLC